MNPADEAILQLLGSPKKLELIRSEIAWNTGYGPTHVSNRVTVLVETGLLEKVVEEGSYPHYRTTTLGERYLDNKVSIQEMKEIGEQLDDEP
jgi:DNA-binding transcriptional ArsR family regulator